MLLQNSTDVIWCATVFVLGGLLCAAVGRSVGLNVVPLSALYAWHSAWALLFSSYILSNGGDSFTYFQRARFDFVEPVFGTDFIVWLTSFPASIGLGFWPISFMYNVAGALGLIFIWATLQEVTAAGPKSGFSQFLVLLCLLLPSMSFWTSGIGKDSIAFLSVGMMLWSTLDLGRRQLAAMAAVVIMLTIRPHIACLIVLSMVGGALLVRDLRGSIRFGIGALATAAATFAVPLALFYSGATRFSSLREFITDRQEHNMGGGSSIDIVEMNPMLRLFGFLYRPLPNETSGIAQFAASIDNVILIFLTLIGLVAIYRAGFVRSFRTYSIPCLYGLSGLVLLSQVTANLGLAARQKWMLVPALMMLFLGARSLMLRKEAAQRPNGRARLGAPQVIQ